MSDDNKEAIPDESSVGSSAARDGTGGALGAEPDSGELSRDKDDSAGYGGDVVGRDGQVVASVDGSSVEGHADQGAPGQVVTSIESHYVRIAPLPAPEEFEAYEVVLSGAADRIVSMAEKSQDAQIEDNHRAAKAEQYSFIFASFGVTFFPWLLAIATIILGLAGQPAAATVTGIVTAGAAGPQIIAAVRSKSVSAKK